MITFKSPLRITLGGGGTDLPSYYRSNGGLVVSAAIDKYVYVTVNNPFLETHILKYSSIEKSKDPSKFSHPIIREAFSLLPPNTGEYLEISSMADVPAGTGLGSSGAFTASLLSALAFNSGKSLDRHEMASLCCHLEMDLLKEPIGKQDQYVTVFGGIKKYVFEKDDSVQVHSLGMSRESMAVLSDNLMLFYTGVSRSASNILSDQDKRSKLNDREMISELDYVKQSCIEIENALTSGDFDKLGIMMHDHWVRKRARSPGMTSPWIDEAYEAALKAGASGGKLVGAGGGGFLLLYSEHPNGVRKKLLGSKLRELRFSFDERGTSKGFI